VARASASRSPGSAVRGLTRAAAEKLLCYAWPGNVRELENCIDHAVALARGDEITVEDLPESVRTYRSTDLSIASLGQTAELLSMEEVERRHILRVLRSVGGSKAAAAAVLGLHPSTLYRKLDLYTGR
jgi:two-component system response regulator AtoC